MRATFTKEQRLSGTRSYRAEASGIMVCMHRSVHTFNFWLSWMCGVPHQLGRWHVQVFSALELLATHRGDAGRPLMSTRSFLSVVCPLVINTWIRNTPGSEITRVDVSVFRLLQKTLLIGMGEYWYQVCGWFYFFYFMILILVTTVNCVTLL